MPSGETITNASELGYTGALRLSEGLVYLNARVYDPKTRRFLQPDDIDARRYVYAGGDPINQIDPSGHETMYWNNSGYMHKWRSGPVESDLWSVQSGYQMGSSDDWASIAKSAGGFGQPQYGCENGCDIPGLGWVSGDSFAANLVRSSLGGLSAQGGVGNIICVVGPSLNVEETTAFEAVALWVQSHTALSVAIAAGVVVGGAAVAIAVEAGLFSAAATGAVALEEARGGQDLENAQGSISRVISNAEMTGTALEKSDAFHAIAERAQVFIYDASTSTFQIQGGDKQTATLYQTLGTYNGLSGVFEYIINSAGELSHQTFIAGQGITGAVNQWP